jgi:hypothetical protein
MPLLPVATSGSVSATPGSAPPGNTGTWAVPATIDESAYPELTVAGTPVIWKAVGTFTFTGTVDATGVASTIPPSDVTLTAAPTVLQGGGTSVLRHGDNDFDEYGNTLTVASTAALRST